VSATLSLADYLLAGGAAVLAGAINGIAGGGTLVSFPALIAIGVPALAANVTNTVALLPGYLSGTVTARRDLEGQAPRLKVLLPCAAAGGLAGSLLLEVTPEKAFRAAVPWLVLTACVLLLAQDPVRRWVVARQAAPAGGQAALGEGAPARAAPGPATAGAALAAVVAVASVYGGFFGAGLGIMLLAVLGVLCADSLVRLNAVKQSLSLSINVVAAACFALTGHVRWQLVPVMAVAALAGGALGSRAAQRIDPGILRRIVVVFGVAVAISFFVD
jgi:uncharacterized protein